LNIIFQNIFSNAQKRKEKGSAVNQSKVILIRTKHATTPKKHILRDTHFSKTVTCRLSE
jgi:hypothetical protein